MQETIKQALLAKERLKGLNMRLFHSAEEYFLSMGILSEKEAALAKDFQKKWQIADLELAAFQLGLISDEELVKALVEYQGKEIVAKDEVEQLVPVFDTFRYEICIRYHFFEYENTDKSCKWILASYDAKGTEDILKREFEEYRIRETIPLYITNKLKRCME